MYIIISEEKGEAWMMQATSFSFIMTSQSHTMSWRNKGNQDIPGFYSGTEGWQFSVSSDIVNLPANLFVGRVPLRATSLLDDLHQFRSFLDFFFVHRRTPTPKRLWTTKKYRLAIFYLGGILSTPPADWIAVPLRFPKSSRLYYHSTSLCIIRDKIYLRQWGDKR